MANVSGYEVVRPLPSTGGSTLSLARKTGTRAAPAFVIRSLNIAEDWDAHQSAAAARDFVSAAELQKQAAAASRHWAMVHDIDPAAPAFVTDYYDKSVEWLASRRITLTAADLHRLVDATVAGLEALEQACGRAHGDLAPSNILFTTRNRIARAKVVLTDPLPGRRLRADARRADLKALGAIVFELVTHESFKDVDHFPLAGGDFDGKIDKNAGKWVQLCNELLDPNAEMDLATVRQRVNALKPAGTGWKWAAVAAVAVLVIGGGLFALLTMEKAVPPEKALANWKVLVDEHANWFNRFAYQYDTEVKSNPAFANDPSVQAINALMDSAKLSKEEPRLIADKPGMPFDAIKELPVGRHLEGSYARTVDAAVKRIAEVRKQLEKPSFLDDVRALETLPGAPGAYARDMIRESAPPAPGKEDTEPLTAMALRDALAQRAAMAQWRQRTDALRASVAEMAKLDPANHLVTEFKKHVDSELGKLRLTSRKPEELDPLNDLSARLLAFLKEDWKNVDQAVFGQHAASKGPFNSSQAFEEWLKQAAELALPKDKLAELLRLANETNAALEMAKGGLTKLQEEQVAATTIEASTKARDALAAQVAGQRKTSSVKQYDQVKGQWEQLKRAAEKLKDDIASASDKEREAWVMRMREEKWPADMEKTWLAGVEQLRKDEKSLKRLDELGRLLKARLAVLNELPAAKLPAAQSEYKPALEQLAAKRRDAAVAAVLKQLGSAGWHQNVSALDVPVEAYKAFLKQAGQLDTMALALRSGLNDWYALNEAPAGMTLKLAELRDECEKLTRDEAELKAVWAGLRMDVEWVDSLNVNERTALLAEASALPAESWKLWYVWRALVGKAPGKWTDLKAEAAVLDRLGPVAARKVVAANRVPKPADQLKSDAVELWHQSLAEAKTPVEIKTLLHSFGKFVPDRKDVRMTPRLAFNLHYHLLQTELQKELKDDEITRLVQGFHDAMKPHAAALPAEANQRVAALVEALKQPEGVGANAAGGPWPGSDAVRARFPWKVEDRKDAMVFTWDDHVLEFVRVTLPGGNRVYVCRTEVSIGLFADIYRKLRQADKDAMEAMTHQNRRGLLGWNASESEIGLNRVGLGAQAVGHWVIDITPPGDGTGYWGPGTGLAAVRAEPGKFKHMPTLKHPMHNISRLEAETIARAIGCELPSESAWRAALAIEKAAGKGVPNVRDAAWAQQRTFANPLGLTLSTLGSLDADADDLSTWLMRGDEFVGLGGSPHNDGAAWTVPVAQGNWGVFSHLIGNVAEYVVGEGPNKDKVVVIGGSALTSTNRPLERATDIPARRGAPEKLAFSDVGFRLAFSEPIKPLVLRVREKLDDTGYAAMK